MVSKEDKLFAKNFNIDDLPDVPTELAPHLKLQQTRFFKNAAPIHTGGNVTRVDDSVKLEHFYEDFKVDVISLTETDMEFDMIGIDASFANAFRRILIAEKMIRRMKRTLLFSNSVKCPKNRPRLKVLTKDLKWLPNGSEFLKEVGGSTSKPKTYTSFDSSQDSFPEFANNPITPSHLDILIAKLAPGQEIELEAHAVKGIGKTHAKWSPVATAWYRMHPEVVLLGEVKDELAERLVKVCPQKVFDIEDMGKGRKRATVAQPHKCTLCKECLRDEDLVDRVDLRSIKNHFICKKRKK